VVLGIAISYTSWGNETITVFGRKAYPSSLLIGTFITAHLALVFVRSHGNPAVFKRTPWRFTVVPALLFVALYNSLWLCVVVGAVSICWDVYHSSLQTFGLGRIYDMRAGNDPELGRRLDQWLNHLLYIGPIVGGVTLVNHLKLINTKFDQDPSAFFTAIPIQGDSFNSSLTWVVLGLGTPFVGYYVYRYWRLAKEGYSVSPQKVLLLASTGICSIYTWGFNSFGEAFFIMNFFHAWQYFAIVWWSDGKGLIQRLRLEGRSFGKPLVLVLFVGLPLAYGAWVTLVPRGHNVLFCVALVVSIMHFWYDGFVWSVRKSQV
jgi:hypothetical protein